MIKFVCDKCRCEVYMTFMPFSRKAVLIDGANRTTYDLCKKCMYEVRMFITGTDETEPQTDIGTSDTVYSDTAGYVPRVDMTDCSWK